MRTIKNMCQNPLERSNLAMQGMSYGPRADEPPRGDESNVVTHGDNFKCGTRSTKSKVLPNQNTIVSGHHMICDKAQFATFGQ